MWRSETLRRLPLDVLLDEAVSFYRADPLHNATISTSNCYNIDPKSMPLPIHTNTFASESDTSVNKKRKMLSIQSALVQLFRQDWHDVSLRLPFLAAPCSQLTSHVQSILHRDELVFE